MNGMSLTRRDLINDLIARVDAKSYLEIGYGSGWTFNTINCEKCIAVDPYSNPSSNKNSTGKIVKKTSDAFFSENTDQFDVILIDGLHLAEQAYRDIKNSLKLNPYYIICHDLDPIIKEWGLRSPSSPAAPWTGDCWKAWVEFRKSRADISMMTLNYDEKFKDYGVGIICNGTQIPLVVSDELTWENFIKNRKEWLNLISLGDFYHIIENRHRRRIIHSS